MEPELQEQFKKQLEKDKKQLIKNLESFAKRDPQCKGDWETIFPQMGIHRSEPDEHVDEVEEYESLLPIEHRLELRLQAIDQALEKIEKGTYGICERCGQEIELERLKACPEAKKCLGCKD